MLVYSIIMFLVAALFTVLGISIYKGKTDLIHDYHQTKVTDKSGFAGIDNQKEILKKQAFTGMIRIVSRM